MTQEDLDSIAKNGLINHIRDGKRFAEHKDVRKCGIETVMGEQCYVVKHDRTRIFLAFKVDSHDKNNTIGKNYKN